MKFVIGQRWFSQTEPELGLGLIEATEQRRLRVLFPAADERRVYAEDRAPLQRFELKVGQPLEAADGLAGEIISIEEQRGIQLYHIVDQDGAEQIVPEMLLAHELHLDSADKRLLSGQVNHLHWYQLRHRFKAQYADYQQQPMRGYLGGRIQLTPHQYYVAQAATAQGMPRVLLSDEVGLGKTIEAGLILHYLISLGRARRCLICVPDHLIHQWLVEMIRKFDLPFSVFDDSRLDSVAEEAPEINPFETEQQILVPISLWSTRPAAVDQALACDWDVMIIDEAHHLDWHPEHPGPEFQTIAALSAKTPSVLLLTATPEQDGSASHFARLQLLDPVHFNDFEQYRQQEARLGQLSESLSAFLERPDQPEKLADWCQDDYSSELLANATASTEESDLQSLVDYLIDIHGTGRVQFRNTRDRIKGFPERRVQAHTLPCPSDYDRADPWPERNTIAWTETDPRVEWLADLIRETDGKVLVICHHASTARGLEGHLRLREGLATTQFHEGMDLVERDRAAAWFADPDDGADALICSEIGSEGRNFQFAHTLVCFDLPAHPDLLEQRIGRLDRIGQTRSISVHVPCLEDHISTHWFRWYHEGLNAFEQTCAVGEAVLQQLLPNAEVPHSLLALPTEIDALEDQINRARKLGKELKAEQKAGKNRLLEWHSLNQQVADDLIEQIAAFESRLSPESVVTEALDHLGMEVENEGQGLFSVRPGEKMIPDSFPFMSDEGALITFRRSVAVSREDVRFITWEHPLIDFIMETLDSTQLGTAGVTLISLPSLPKGSLFLEASFLPMMQHPSRIQASRFLPQALFTRVVSQDGKDVSQAFQGVDWRDLEKRLEKQTLLEIIKSQHALIEQLVKSVRLQAKPGFQETVNTALNEARNHHNNEQARLLAQTERSGQHAPQLLADQKQEADAVADAINHAELHLDNLRLIVNY